MFLRIFTIANDVETSEKICEELLSKLNKYIEKKTYLSNKPYWKMEGVYSVEVKLKLRKKMPNVFLNEFYCSIANKWISYGSPENEVLFSNNIDGCNFKNDNILMLNIFLEVNTAYNSDSMNNVFL